MDRAGFHRKKTAWSSLKKARGVLLGLPANSPDCDSIEKTRANMKKDLRNAAPSHGLTKPPSLLVQADTFWTEAPQPKTRRFFHTKSAAIFGVFKKRPFSTVFCDFSRSE
jgi:hypothetical protein